MFEAALLLHWNLAEPGTKVWAVEKRDGSPLTAWGNAGWITCRKTTSSWMAKREEKRRKGYVDLGLFSNLTDTSMPLLAEATAWIGDSIRSGQQLPRPLQAFPADRPEMSEHWLCEVARAVRELATHPPERPALQDPDPDLHVVLSTGRAISLSSGRVLSVAEVVEARERQVRRAELAGARATAHLTIVEVQRPAPTSTQW